MRGWKLNSENNLKRVKVDIQKRLQQMEEDADFRQLSPEEWEQRYFLEDKLNQIYHEDEVYSQERSGGKWILEGDSNTTFFHGLPMGERGRVQTEL